MKWFFAYRYLISHKSRSVINIITLLCIVSVAVPLAAMIILLSVFNGFETLARQMYDRADADLEIVQRNDREPSEIFEIGAENRQKILDVEGVDAAAFVIEHELLLQYGDAFMLSDVRGVDAAYFDVVVPSEGEIRDYAELEFGEIDRAIIDNYMAYTLGISTLADSRLQLQTLGRSEIGSMLPMRGIRSRQLHIAAIKNSLEQEKHHAIVPLHTMQQLYDTNRATTIAIRTSDGNLSAIKTALESLAGEGASVRTRDEKNALFYAIMRYEKWAIFFVALLVLIIASMSIIGSVIMLITEKRNEQITLLSIGCNHRFIRDIFVCEGLLIAAFGGAIGTIIGIATIAIQHYFGVLKLPENGFIIENYPVELHLNDVVITYVAFTVIALAASYIATRKMIKNRELCSE
ncbi:MAG: ABC transporter permease [Alistipes sp.]|nr:ABC transporter permease [Alistipes sp.]